MVVNDRDFPRNGTEQNKTETVRYKEEVDQGGKHDNCSQEDGG